jgi:cytochrome c-type biogenesis protein CcmH/NrfF
VRRFAAVLAVALLAVPAAARASERHPTLAELEGEVMCPTCAGETLDQSTAPAARRVKLYIAERIRAGDTKSEIERRLVVEFGPAILAAPPKRGFDLLAWWLPLVGIAVAAAVLGVAAWRWSRSREPEPAAGGAVASGNGRARIDPELERRLDDELARFE